MQSQHDNDSPSLAQPKRIHIIGVCGVGTSAIAIALHQRGWRVSGSDKGFYPPVSTALAEAGVPYYAGWHPEKMISAEYGGAPEVIMIGGSGKASGNPEMLYAREHSIPMLSYPEILEQYFVRENSIVCAGTWGKTTSTTLLTFIMQEAGFDPSYMFGGLSLSQDQAAKLTDSQWSVLEGDEYTGSQTDTIAKFFHYHPTHLLMTSVSWDHADVYPTEKSYFEAFEKLVAGLPKGALLVACTDDRGVQKILKGRKISLVSYGKNLAAAYRYQNVIHSKAGLMFDIVVHDKKTADKKAGGEKIFRVASPMLGAYNAENITACFAMACEIGIAPEKIVAAIAEFKGIKRRLERRYAGGKDGVNATPGALDVTVLDCHAPTAEKAQSVLASIREVFPAPSRVIAVFEPNIGGRQRETAHLYDGAFAAADEIVIPRLTVLKKDSSQKEKTDKEEPLEGPELAKIISKTAPGTTFIEDDAALVSHIVTAAKNGDVIAFLGSHGFRGMIEETIADLASLA